MAYNPFGNSTGVEDFRKPFGSDTGVENFSNDISEEERKRKLALLTDLYNGGNVGDMASKLIGERIAPIQEAITNPENAIRQRFGMPIEQTQQGGPVAPMPNETNAETQRLLQQNQLAQQTPTAPVMPVQPGTTVQPTASGAEQPTPQSNVELSPEAQQDIQKRAQALEAQQAQQNQPTAPVNPNEVVQQVNQTQLPQPGAGVQVAGPTVTPPPPAPQWSQDLNNAQGDVTKLHAIAGNANYPEDVRKLAGELTAKQYKGQLEEKKANDTIQNAFSGQDPKALNQVMSDLRKSSNEGSYLKAILYQRLGLGELAKEEQQKLGAGSKISQAMVDGKQYTVEYGGNGDVKRAWNAEGVRMDDKELAKISAGGMKAGTHAFGFTGESVTIPQGQPDAGQEYRQRTNSITGQVENVISTGPNAGKLYTGSPGYVKSVQTAAAKIDYGLGADLYKKHSGNVLDMLKEYEMIKGPQSPEGRQAFLSQYGYGQTVNQPSLPGAPTTGAPAGAMQQPNVQPSQVTPQGNVVAPRPQQNVQNVQGNAPIVSAPITTTATPGVGGRVAGGVSGQGISGMKAQQELGVTAGKENIQVQGQRAQSFNKILDEEVRPQAQAGDTVVQTRKQQFAIFDRPGIDANRLFGLYTAAQESPGDQKLSIIRDIFGGIYKEPNDVSQRLAQLNLTPEEKSALSEYNIANQRINAATLKQNSGPGSISDTEQRANREANVDITKIPALGAYNGMAQSQFTGDLARYKADWALTQPATNALQLDKAWRKEQTRLTEVYGNIAKQRAEFISKNGATFNAVKEGYKRYPIPEYDPNTESWKKTKPLAEILGK